MIFKRQEHKNSYLICPILKNSKLLQVKFL